MFLSEGNSLHSGSGGGTTYINNNHNGSYSKLSAIDGKESMGVAIGLIFFYTFVAILALLSNVIILVTVIKRYVSRNTVNTFLCSLATSDLFMVVFSLMDFAAYLKGTWIFGVWSCKIQSYILEISFTASTLTLVAVSVERYLLICRPYMKRRSIQSIYKILGFVWLIAFVLCSPLLVAYDVVPTDVTQDDGSPSMKCQNNWGLKGELLFYGIYSIFTYLIPFIVMAFAHWRISLSVKENNDRRASAQSTLIKDKKASVCYTIREEASSTTSTEKAVEETENEKAMPSSLPKAFVKSISGLNTRIRTNTIADREVSRREKRVKAIRLLFVVTITFFALWTPFVFLRLLRDAGVQINIYVYTFSEIIIFSSTAVNGFIYAFMSRPFLNAFKAILCCRSQQQNMSRDSGPSYSNSEDNGLSNRSYTLRWMCCCTQQHVSRDSAPTYSVSEDYRLPPNRSNTLRSMTSYNSETRSGSTSSSILSTSPNNGHSNGLKPTNEHLPLNGHIPPNGHISPNGHAMHVV